MSGFDPLDWIKTGRVKKANVLRSAFLVGGFTSMSRVLGLARDFLTAGFFGTSLAMSAFVVAFRIPNMFRALFGEGALSSAFIPVFIETRRRDGEAAAWSLARKIITLVGLALLGVVVLGIAVLSAARALAPAGSKTFFIVSLARIMLPYLFFICLAGISMGILNSYHRFALPASTPSLLNLVWIAFVLFVCPRAGRTINEQIYGLAWGVFAAGIVQLAAQIPALMRRGYRPGLALDLRDERVLRVFKLMGPAALGLAVTQVNVMINSLLAAWVGPWAPAALFYSERLIYLPQGLLATAMSTVLLPVLSGHAAREEHAQIRETINHSLRSVFFIMAPAALGLLALARPIVQMIFEWNRFTPASTDLTAVALQFYAPGLLVFCLAKVFVPAFYAAQDTRTPVKIGLLCVTLNFALNVLFLLTWPLRLKHASLALATVLSEGVNGLLLGCFLHRRFGSPGWKTIFASAARILLCAGATAACAALIQSRLAGLLDSAGWPAKANQIAAVLASIAAAMGIYFAAAAALRCPEIGHVREAFRRRGNNRAAGCE